MESRREISAGEEGSLAPIVNALRWQISPTGGAGPNLETTKSVNKGERT